MAASERLYKALGLLPADADLKQMQLDMLSAGVAGFYRDDEKKMYVVSRTGSLSAEDKVTYAHEYTHALQDQHHTVFKDQQDALDAAFKDPKKVHDRSDWILARQAVYEGDATVLMSHWLVGNLTPEELASVMQGGASAAEQQAVLDSMPAILRETLLFPYTTGAFYVQAAQAAGGWPAVDDFYARMPESTEQILHPEKYAAGEAPVAVDVPGRPGHRSRDRLERAARGHVRRVPAGHLAPRGRRGGRGGRGRGGRLGRRPPGGHRRAGRGLGAGDADRVGHARGRGGRSRPPRAPRSARPAGPDRSSPGAGGNVRWVVVADDDETLGTVAGALGLAG